MDLRTKLVFALVAVSLASLLALGAVAYSVVAGLLQDAAVRQLEAVAASKELDLRNVAQAWRDRVRLITSRTQLRESMRRQASGGPDQRARIARIVEDALDAAPTLRGIALFTSDGSPVVIRGDVGGAAPSAPTERVGEPPWVETDVTTSADGRLVVTFLGPLELEGTSVGVARVALDAAALADVVSDATGLGETGETLVARAAPEGGASLVAPRRHASAPAAGSWKPTNPDADPVLAAIDRREATLLHAVDDRSEQVWAATRFVEEMGWGLVVKLDASQATAPARALRETMVRMALSLSALAIVVGILLGIALARPISALADVARRIEDGDLEARADARGEDEVARLAGAFNEMTERLIAANRTLERRVRQAENGEHPGP